jgi:penicillin-binding protein 2
MIRKRSHRDIAVEESLSDAWSEELGVLEVPLDERPFWIFGALALFAGMMLVGRMVWLSVLNGPYYSVRAEMNQFQLERIAAPRGIITDRFGKVIADNAPSFSVVLDLKRFLLESPEEQSRILGVAEHILGVAPDEAWRSIAERNAVGSGDPIPLRDDVAHQELVALEAERIPALRVVNGYRRVYAAGSGVSSVVGYLGFPTQEQLESDATLGGHDMVGKTGVEAMYDTALRGAPGYTAQLRNAIGRTLGEAGVAEPEAGKPLQLTIDLEFQQYFYRRFAQALAELGRTSGVGIAMNPQNGEVLALMNFPSYDANIFSSVGRNDEKRALLASPNKPLFPRAVSGLYSPGSTIKPLHGIAALAERVVPPTRAVFSPGWLDVPNPYDPGNPTRFLDWRFQGEVDLASAIAQSSNVYFYLVGGGSPSPDPQGIVDDRNKGIRGLGIELLRDWWKKFRLDRQTGIDLPGEARGFMPSPEWKQEQTGRPWLLGDTYNVSIGQGDLTVTPIALLSYIATIAKNGVMYEPHVSRDIAPSTIGDLSAYAMELREVQKGMRQTVTSPVGTAYLLHDLPVLVAAKTGSAQVRNNREENAFFVGYAPVGDPQLAILILVENAKEGSLNAVPIARDVFAWYYENRLKTRN